MKPRDKWNHLAPDVPGSQKAVEEEECLARLTSPRRVVIEPVAPDFDVFAAQVSAVGVFLRK
jgi:hypothetical protein